MPAYYDASISGDGSASLSGGTSVLYFAVHFTAQGAEARELEVGSPDHLLRLGWVALGRNLTLPSDSARDYWMEPIHLNFLNTRWTMAPNGNASGSFFMSADRVRWHLSSGAAARLYVFGV